MQIAELPNAFKELLEPRRGFYGQVLLQSCLFLDDGKWWNAFTRIVPQERDKQPEKRQPLTFPRVVFVDEIISLDELAARLVNLVRNQTFCIAERDVQFPQPYVSDSDLRQPGNTDLSLWPCLCLNVASREPRQFNTDYLVSHDVMRAFSGLHEGIVEWLGLRKFAGNSDGRLYHLLVALPDYRLRIAKITYTEVLTITLEGAASIADARCIVLAQSDEGRQEHHTTFTNQSAIMSLHGHLYELGVFVTLPPDEIVDSYRETQYWHTGVERWLRSPRKATEIVQELSSGENDVIEYKPFISPKDRKERELVETAIALANTKGGSILLGVDNHGVPHGLQQDLAKLGHRERRSDPASWYTGHLRSLFGQCINKRLEITTEYVDIQGKTILRVHIEEGTDKPYATQPGNEIFIRRNATNKRPDPESELPELLRKHDTLSMAYPGRLSSRF